jgi:Holliday junction resolvase-like predicted endonuclease
MAPEVAFVPATFALRPPRVAILFADDQNWRDWAMLALATASDYWGGGGFILVPYSRETGEPSPLFAEVVRAYDPDHVVTLEVSASQMEDWYPGHVRIGGVKNEEERDKLARSIHGGVDDAAGRRARSVVASWCSPMRSVRFTREEPARQMETIDKLRQPDRSDRYRRGLALAPLTSTSPRLAASASWRSDSGMSAALRIGVANAEPVERSEPGTEVLSWLISPRGDAPSALAWSPTFEMPETTRGVENWFLAGQRLMQVSRWHLRDRAAVVIGNTGADFALALAYDRIIGRSTWLTPSLLNDASALNHHLRDAVWTLISDLEHSAYNLIVASVSLTPRQLAKAAERLQEPEHEFQRSGVHRQRAAEREIVQVRFANVERGLLSYVVNEHVGASSVIPMSVLEDGTQHAMTRLDSPIPNDLLYPDDISTVPYWYVDVALERDQSPRGRDLPGSALTFEENQYPEVNIRASKDGVSYEPSSMGIVMSGTLLVGRIGRPRLRSLSIRAWVEGMAEASGLGVRLSMPGRHAELLRRRLGTRKQLVELIASPALQMLREFIPRSEVPKERVDATVVLGLDPYLSFAAMDALLPGPEEETTALIDTLSAARLLRRGLVLGCSECGRPSFLDADKLGQQYECPQCATVNSLVSERWRKGKEPTWFYDLFATFRELLKSNGDVPLLAAARLQADGRDYADTPELEFFELETKAPVAEVDVIASTNREVVLVEAKSSNSFSHGMRARQTEKLLRVASALRADRIVLATTQDDWKQTDVDYLAREANKATPFPLAVDVMSRLGRSPSQ